MPVLGSLMAPGYPFKINPAQIAALVQLVEATRKEGAAVIEIGVAQGDTSVFLLEHLKTTSDERDLLLFDTFNGFTEDSINFEVERRGKPRAEYGKFKYGNEAIFRRRLTNAGYSKFQTFSGDASKVNWSKFGPIGAVLLDIDLYAPTKIIMDNIYPYLCPGGGIVVDDCLANSPWDGSLQAYQEFIDGKNLPFVRLGKKGGLITKI